MPRNLDRVPIREHPRPAVLADGREVQILPYQVVVWVSIAPPAELTLDPRTPRFPAVFDSGFNHSFLIREEQLVSWAGLHAQQFHLREWKTVYGLRVPWQYANIWIHPNQPGERDQLLNRDPFCIRLTAGIGICPSSSPRPRLPLLGLRALFAAELELTLDCRRGFVSLRTPRRFWLFG